MGKAPDEDFVDAVQQYRRERLVALIAIEPYSGNLSALGRKLGYKDGVFVRQMRDHERAITEKTVAKIEAVHPGWFDQEPAELEAVGETDWTMLTAYRDMSDDDREEMLRQALEKAERFKKLTSEALRRAAGGPNITAKSFEPAKPVPVKTGTRYIRKLRTGKTTPAKKSTKDKP